MWTAQQIIQKRKELWNEHQSIEKDQEFVGSVAEYLVSPEGELLRQEISAEPRLLIEMVFVIVDKEMKTMPFFLNDVQREFSNDLYQAEEDHANGILLFIKFLVLKGRQQGFTAYITAEQLARTVIKRNFSGFTIADLTDNTQTIFEDKAKFPYNRLPEVLRPTEKFNNRKELLFEKLNSKWRVATATKNIARSKTINFLHISEAAFLECNISDIQAAVGDALTKDAIQIYETTANGYGEFKDVWDSGEFICKFYEWWRTTEYRIDFESPDRGRQFKTDVQTKLDWIFERCRWLIKRGRDWQQVYWYYQKWKAYLDKEKIKQEYPCTADEAFLASGRCVFDKEKLIQRKEYLRERYQEQPPKRGYFLFEWNNPDTKDRIKDNTIKFADDPNGYITIYEDKQPGYPYVLGGDTKGEGSDFFASKVMNNVTGKRCATLHANLDPDTYAHQTYCLGKYFNYALISIEINFDIYPVKELQRLGYTKQYKREIIDEISKKKQHKYGFKTDGNTRPLIISKEISLIRDNIDLFTDIAFLDECLTFVYDKDNRPDAQSGKNDDILFADMITNETRTQQRMTVCLTAELEFPESMTEAEKVRARANIEFADKYEKMKGRLVK